MCETGADIIALTETWLKESDDAVRAEVQPMGYKLVDVPRPDRRGGGTALLYRDSIKVSKCEAGVRSSFEFSEWKVTLPSFNNLRVIVVYRAPYSEVHKVSSSTFFTEFSDYAVVLCNERLLITGDFNFHVDIPTDGDGIKFLDILQSFCLEQHVVGPTHVDGHTLDLIITRQSDNIIDNIPKIDCFLSDHAAILCSLRSDKPSLSAKNVSYRLLKSIDMTAFDQDLAYSKLCQSPPDDINELVECYNSTLKSVLDKHAPLKTKVIVELPHVPWFNEEIKDAKRKRRKAERKWRSSRQAVDLASFKYRRNVVTRLMNKARREFYSNFIDAHNGDQKKLFNITMKLLNQSKTRDLPSVPNSSLCANSIGRFFYRKIADIRAQFDNDIDSVAVEVSTTAAVSSNDVWSLSNFEMLTEEDVSALVKNSSRKTCPLDPMPSTLVSKCGCLLPIITKIINTSLKEALVFPLLKETAADFTFKNLRPVSNLPFISKLTENAVSNQTHCHMTVNNLFPPFQSAYRKNHSTETALLKITNDILLNMNKQHVTLLVVLDLSAAFDTIDQDILLNRLSTKFGIEGTVLKWFSSYLKGRSQRVSVHGTVSEKFALNWGVPQGSCLGPLLYTIYASELFTVIKDHLPDAHCFSDDSQLYLSFSPNEEQGEVEAVKNMELCVNDIRNWMSKDKLLMNDRKTEFLIIGTRQQLQKVNIKGISVGIQDISPAILQLKT